MADLPRINSYARQTAEAWPSPPDPVEADACAATLGGSHSEWRAQVVVVAVLRQLKQRGAVVAFTATIGDLIGELSPQRRQRVIMGGYEAGIPDLIVALPGGSNMWIETKSRGAKGRRGVHSSAQTSTGAALSGAGHLYVTEQGAGALLVAMAAVWPS